MDYVIISSRFRCSVCLSYSITRELYSGQLRVVEIKGMPMLRDFSFAQPQGQESGLAQVFMQFAMHNNHKL